MTVDFSKMEYSIIPNFKGGEKDFKVQMYFDGTYRVMHGFLTPGASIGEHTHEENSEVIFVLRGDGTIIDDGVATPICAGQSTLCAKGHSHSLVNTGEEDMEIYATVI